MLEPPARLLPAIAELVADALQVGHEFVAQLVDGAALPGVGGGGGRSGGLDGVGRRVLVHVAEDAGEAGERLEGAPGHLDGLVLQGLRVALREPPQPLRELIPAMAGGEPRARGTPPALPGGVAGDGGRRHPHGLGDPPIGQAGPLHPFAHLLDAGIGELFAGRSGAGGIPGGLGARGRGGGRRHGNGFTMDEYKTATL